MAARLSAIYSQMRHEKLYIKHINKMMKDAYHQSTRTSQYLKIKYLRYLHYIGNIALYQYDMQP